MKVTIENDFRRGLSGTRNLDPVGWVFAAMKPSLKVDSGNDGQFCIQFSGPQSAIADAAATHVLKSS